MVKRFLGLHSTTVDIEVSSTGAMVVGGNDLAKLVKENLFKEVEGQTYLPNKFRGKVHIVIEEIETDLEIMTAEKFAEMEAEREAHAESISDLLRDALTGGIVVGMVGEDEVDCDGCDCPSCEKSTCDEDGECDGECPDHEQTDEDYAEGHK